MYSITCNTEGLFTTKVFEVDKETDKRFYLKDFHQAYLKKEHVNSVVINARVPEYQVYSQDLQVGMSEIYAVAKKEIDARHMMIKDVIKNDRRMLKGMKKVIRNA